MYILPNKKSMIKSKKRNFWEIIKKLFSPLKKIKKPYHWVFSVFFRSIYDVYTIFLFSRLGSLIDSGNYDDIKKLIVEFAIILVIYIGGKYRQKARFRPQSVMRLKKYMRKRYLKEYINLDNTHVEKIWTGRLINVIKEGIWKWIATLIELQSKGPDLILKLSVALYFIFKISVYHWLVFIVLVSIVQSIVIYINKFAIQKRIKRKNIDIAHSRFFVRFLNSKNEIFQSSKTNFELKKQNKLLDKLLITNLGINNVLWLMYNVPLWFTNLLSLFIVYYARSAGVAWTFSFAIFNALLLISGYLWQLVINTTQAFKVLTKQFTEIEKLRNLFDTTPKQKANQWKLIFKPKRSKIELHSVSFNYDESDLVFEDFNIEIQWWKKTALVGPSWSWKSTLIKLISGYIRPDKWYITVDWQQLPTDDRKFVDKNKTVKLQSYYEHIGYLTQEPSVFDGTIRENLLYANNKKISDVKLKKVIKAAKCEFIYRFANGLDTEIWERGVRLSWGQCQRLAIAKIFIKNPEIVLLDEPTSALDSFSEEAISEAMHNLFKWRTVIIIAHRLQTIKEADEIIVLEEWKVIERWNHTSLNKKKWHYHKMLKLQSGF